MTVITVLSLVQIFIHILIPLSDLQQWSQVPHGYYSDDLTFKGDSSLIKIRSKSRLLLCRSVRLTAISTCRPPHCSARFPSDPPDTNTVSVFSFARKMFLSPGFEIEQMPVIIVIIGVPRGKFGKMNVFKYCYSLLCMEEILRWKNGYHCSVLGLSNLSTLQASGRESTGGAQLIDPSSLSANEVGIPGALRTSIQQKQGWQESNRDPTWAETMGHSPPPFHRALHLHSTRQAS